MLAAELGIEPSADLVHLEQQILDQTAEAPVSPPTDLEGGGFPSVRGYELRERIGESRLGVVYRAYQHSVGRQVAVRVVPGELANRPDFIRNFDGDAQVVSRLEHPHIVPLYDYWREPDAAFLVTRWIDGGTVIDVGQQAEPERVQRLVEQIGSALTLAHGRGVVHGDLSSRSVLVDVDGNAYVADFGVAGEAAVKGLSEHHLAPERRRGGRPSVPADVYSLGVLTWELLSGQPWTGTNGAAYGAGVDEAIRRATAEAPADRFVSVSTFSQAFGAALGGEPVAETEEGADGNPYRGLEAFQEADAAVFFGRQSLVDQLLGRLESTHGHRFLAVVGASGSGKSSVVRAGLVPALRAGALAGSGDWFIVQMVPGFTPLHDLEAALLRIAVNPPPTLLEQLSRDEWGLRDAANRILPDDSSELLLVVDQFEELFTVADEDQRDQFPRYSRRCGHRVRQPGQGVGDSPGRFL